MKRYLIIGAMVLASFSVGRFLTPAKVETREVEKVVYREHQNTKRDQNYTEVTKETKLPDGTTIKETRKEKDTSTQTQIQKDAESKKSQSVTIDNRPSYRVGVLYVPPIKSFQSEAYGVTLERRLFSELYIGVQVRSDKTAGLTLSIGF